MCVMFFCVLSLSHIVSRVRCGTLLYGFSSFAFFFTLDSDIWHFEFSVLSTVESLSLLYPLVIS